MTNLLPCPFCGSAAELNVFYEDDTVNVPLPICDVEFVVVRCPSCGISKQNRYQSDAVHWWNKRTVASAHTPHEDKYPADGARAFISQPDTGGDE